MNDDALIRVNLAIAMVVVVLLTWFSSGTLSPYAITYPKVVLTHDCGYLGNVDHIHFLKTFLFLKFPSNPEIWSDSIVLRRILYSVISFPFMSVLGFLIGGVITNIFLIWITLFGFVRFFKKRMSMEELVLSVWLLATYPGIYYYAGLPYLYNMVFPVCVFSGIILRKTMEENSRGKIYIYSLTLGVLFTGYELFPFFGLSQLYLIFRKKMRWPLVTNLMLMLLPGILIMLFFRFGYGISGQNSNTEPVVKIIQAWLGVFYTDGRLLGLWMKLLRLTPRALIDNFFTSTFIYLSIVFVVIFFLRRKFDPIRPITSQPFKAVLFSALLLFMFCNLSPPYEGWQMRGDWIGRLYQPIFFEILLFTVSSYALLRKSGRVWLRGTAKCLILFLFLANTLTVFSPVLRSEILGYPYWAFYKHSRENHIEENTLLFGVKPLGICSAQSAKK